MASTNLAVFAPELAYSWRESVNQSPVGYLVIEGHTSLGQRLVRARISRQKTQRPLWRLNPRGRRVLTGLLTPAKVRLTKDSQHEGWN